MYKPVPYDSHFSSVDYLETIKLAPFESYRFSPEYLEHHPPYGREYGQDTPYRAFQYEYVFRWVEPHRLTCPVLSEWERDWVKYIRTKAFSMNLPAQPFIQWFLITLRCQPRDDRINELQIIMEDIEQEIEYRRQQANARRQQQARRQRSAAFSSPKEGPEDPPPRTPVPPPVVPTPLVLFPPSEATSEDSPPPLPVPPPAVFAPLVLLSTSEETSPPAPVPPPAVPAPLVLPLFEETVPPKLLVDEISLLAPSPPLPPPMTPQVSMLMSRPPLPDTVDFFGISKFLELAVLSLRYPLLQLDRHDNHFVWDPGADRSATRHPLLGLHHQLLQHHYQGSMPQLEPLELVDEFFRCRRV